ncbi:MAG: alpha/beta hydrolase [bacterium]
MHSAHLSPTLFKGIAMSAAALIHRLTLSLRALTLLIVLSAIATSLGAQTNPAFSVRRAGVRGQRPIVLIPGLFSSGAVWDGTATHLGNSYDLHVLTLAGFAGIPPAHDKRYFDAERDAIIKYIRDEHLNHPILVGHSLGGALAFAIAATTPDLVGPLIIVDAVPFLPALTNPAATADASRPMADAMRAGYAAATPAQLAVQSGPAFRGLMRDTSHLAQAIDWSAHSDPATVGNAVADMMVTDLRSAVASIRSAVLLVAAGGAAATTPEVDAVRAAYEAQVATIPSHTVVVAQGARHFIMFDAPEFLYQTIDTFLASVAVR